MTGNLTRRQNAILGLVVLACLVIGSWGLLRVANKSNRWSNGFELSMIVPDAQGVEVGTPVQVRGFEAGQVVAVDYADSGVLLKLKLDRSFQSHLHQDATATIQSKGLFGNNVVAISPGTNAAGPLTESTINSKLAPDLNEVTGKLASVAGRVDRILEDVEAGKGTLPKLLKDDTVYNDLRQVSADTKKLIQNLDSTITEVRADAKKTMKGVDESVGIVRSEMGTLKEFVRNGQDAVIAIRQDADAIKAMPIVRSYVDDPGTILVRPDCSKDRMVFEPDQLFEPGTSVLTDGGRERLNEAASWLRGQQQKNSEIVVAAFANPQDPSQTSVSAKTLTKKQSEVLMEYLKDQGVHKMGYITRRKVVPVGQGFDPSPVVEKEKLPAARVELILFVPQG
jgi:phospholipid/cholesterol/gamma-HCH transport system substrate-binding protein